MPRSFGEPLTKLRAVPLEDNGEPLQNPCDLSSRIVFMEKHPRFPDMQRDPRVRRRVAEMLSQAAEKLPEGLGLLIIQGLRTIEQQRFMYEYVKTKFRDEHPEWSKATLHRLTNTLCAPPDDKCPPPHSTGGAFDLCIVNLRDGETLDMVSPMEWDEKSAPTAAKGLSETAQKNRQLLVDTLESVGLSNYTGEWWHWSYGDSGWALRTGAAKAIYDRIPE